MSDFQHHRYAHSFCKAFGFLVGVLHELIKRYAILKDGVQLPRNLILAICFFVLDGVAIPPLNGLSMPTLLKANPLECKGAMCR